ncbi:MAG TPA: ornithine carbamoyltransferase, partial [Candidatus Methylomirabilis sp.]|nr:ornithine carbamoyltransferase [Candidatus Methylomirabilis sp.]
MAMIFEKSSTRTRVSFETGMAQLGGTSMFLSPRDTHLDRGEPVEDTARVISSMVDVIVIRANSHAMVERFAANSRVPVVNALTDRNHPCQLLADIQTYIEKRGDIAGKKAAWIGDGNNVCHSWINAAQQFGFQLDVATPKSYEPNAEYLAPCRDRVTITHDPAQAARGADIVITDTWASMGQEHEKAERMKAFRGFMVDAALMKLANKDAVFMHCLPAYRGAEVAADVIDGPQSVVWDEAENRLHAQKALLEFLLGHTTAKSSDTSRGVRARRKSISRRRRLR